METDGPYDHAPQPYAVERLGDTTVLRLDGDIDATAAPALRSVLADVLDEAPALLRIDMDGVAFIDSVGISVLVAAFNRTRDRGSGFEVASVPPGCLRVFEITRLTDVFPIVP